MDGVAILETEVRELIRRRGLDPVRDRSGVAALVSDAIADYDERSVVGAVPPLIDPAAAHKAVVDAVAGLGPLQKYLDDPEVEEIWINAPTQVFVARRGEAELTTTILTDGQVRDLVEKMLKVSGPTARPVEPVRRREPARRGTAARGDPGRHAAALVGQHPQVRRARDDARRPRRRSAALTPHAAAFLQAAVRAGLNVLVSGGTQAGKTTMLNALAGAIPARERVITCEEVFELRLAARDWVAMQCRQPSLEGTGEIPLRRLVKEALRMRPSRLLVGEVREAEALDLLIALNAGVPAMCTIHANSAREALTKLCTLPLLAGENVSDRFVVPTVASAVDLVVHLDLDGRRSTARAGDRRGARAASSRASSRRRTSSTPRDGHLVRADGLPAAPRAVRPHRHRPGGAPARAGLMGVVVGLLLGAGLACIWWSFWAEPRGAGSRSPDRVARPDAGRAGAGRRLGGDPRRARRWRACCSDWSSCVLGTAVTRIPSIALCFAVFAALAPLGRGAWTRASTAVAAAPAVAGGRRPPRLGHPCRAGAARGRRADRGARTASSCGEAFTAFAEDYRATGRFGECLDAAQGAARGSRGGPDRRGAAPHPRRRRHGPGPAAADPVDVPARGRAHPRRARGAAELDRVRRAARGRRAVDRPRAAGHPARGGERLRHPRRLRRSSSWAARAPSSRTC